LAALDDPNNDGDSSDSIVEDTLVVFQSDNGGPAGKNNSELDANGGLRGNKGKIQEGGIRVPLVMRWPAKITADSKLRAGTDCEKIVDVTDLLPTFCELAGVPAPVGIDGVSIAPTLLGRGHQRYRDFIVHEASNGQSIIRGKYKLVRSKSTPLKLYDLDADHSESDNIASQHPGLVKELEALLLGERVAEPKGFANTYHHWIGEDSAATSDPENWSNYEYANAGITYMSDEGSPRLSWIGRIKNSGNQPHAAHADMDLEFLGLEIAGNVTGKAEQALILGPKVDLLARNEIRLAPYAKLTLDGGCVSSLRWLDIHPNATLNGHGTIQAVLYNQGSVILTGREQTTLRLDGDYHQSDEGELKVTLAGEVPAFQVAGVARLGGTLSIEMADGFKPAQGTSCTVLSAEEVVGSFANAQDEVVSSEGTRFSIRYLPTAVTLIKK
ncbi:MAG: sulfatase/phosphatase domain-containing protein, partial [Planctomycetota bacterium]|nr:sulfatase/phosphatase domain-containing protein [Planctomycetota bacterium]